ncbi:GNAT family N-acetyltransferase [Amnibacterium setariae]|uniref:N-acetyltransferase n=1 Tax=Amnibacterium setariae TaxID=2306585 RepID=A0A3A1U291_9MICO|nr:GNAT family N-acetyltransferase [Amnibacterium setariae]RIX28576.1 N-acetyltransferase [Amnibacterium setariae]
MSRMTIDPAEDLRHDTAADALQRAYALFATRIPGGSVSRDASGVESVVIPVPKARMNGLLLPRGGVDPARLRRLAAPFAGGPWSMSVIDAEPAGVAALAAELGLTRTALPSLTAPIRPTPPGAAGSDATEIRTASTDRERLLWATTCDLAYGSPAGLTARLLTPELAAAPEVRAHLACFHGRPVATALTVLDDRGWLGLFTVGTVPEARRKGIGERLVRFALEDGARRGARTAYLQSSAMARALYERIGFQDDGHPIVSFETV